MHRRRQAACTKILVLAAWAVWPTHAFWGSNEGVKLKQHSIGNPPNIHDLTSEWLLAGTVIPTGKSIFLQPGTPHRGGVIWNQFPLLTNDFEVKLGVRAVKPPASRPPHSDPLNHEGFALWYTYENVSDTTVYDLTAMHAHGQQELIDGSWSNAFTAAGNDLFGYRSKFDGFGVIFSSHDTTPSVIALSNDGKESKTTLSAASTDIISFDWRTGEEITATLRCKPDGAVVEIPGQGKVELKVGCRSGGFLGITVWGGLKRTQDNHETSTVIELNRIEVNNFDAKAVGEELHEVKEVVDPKTMEAGREDVLHESSAFKEHRQESDEIKNLINMVFKLVVETQPVREQMSKALDTLGKRITTMETSFTELKSELDKKTGHHLEEEFSALKKELTSLSSVATKETHERHKRLEELHTDIQGAGKSAGSTADLGKHLTKMADSHTKVIENLESTGTRMFGVSIAAISFIVVAGLSLYQKFRSWEKKHVL